MRWTLIQNGGALRLLVRQFVPGKTGVTQHPLQGGINASIPRTRRWLQMELNNASAYYVAVCCYVLN